MINIEKYSWIIYHIFHLYCISKLWFLVFSKQLVLVNKIFQSENKKK